LGWDRLNLKLTTTSTVDNYCTVRSWIWHGHRKGATNTARLRVHPCDVARFHTPSPNARIGGGGAPTVALSAEAASLEASLMR
jgi:hypothetical protein